MGTEPQTPNNNIEQKPSFHSNGEHSIYVLTVLSPLKTNQFHQRMMMLGSVYQVNDNIITGRKERMKDMTLLYLSTLTLILLISTLTREETILIQFLERATREITMMCLERATREGLKMFLMFSTEVSVIIIFIHLMIHMINFINNISILIIHNHFSKTRCILYRISELLWHQITSDGWCSGIFDCILMVLRCYLVLICYHLWFSR